MTLYSRLAAAMSQPHLSPAAAEVGADIASRIAGYDLAYQEELVSWYEASTAPGGAVLHPPRPPMPMPMPPPPTIPIRVPIPAEIPPGEHWRIRAAIGYVEFVAAMAAEYGVSDAARCRILRREEARILPGHDQPHLRRAVARYPAVAALARAWRVLAAKLDGDAYRGMIPGGEDEAAYLAAIRSGVDDPDPIWSGAPVFVGEDWG